MAVVQVKDLITKTLTRTLDLYVQEDVGGAGSCGKMPIETIMRGFDSTIVYVSSSNGIDDVNAGSLSNPYLTLGYALTQITDNSITKNYRILLTGEFSEPTLSFKPYVFIDLQNSSLTITGAVNLDSSFVGTSGNFGIYNGSLLDFQSGMTLDFTGVTGNCNFYFKDCFTSTTAALYTFTGITSSIISLYISNILCVSNRTDAPDFTINNCTFEIVNIQTANFICNSTALALPGNYGIDGLIYNSVISQMTMNANGSGAEGAIISAGNIYTDIFINDIGGAFTSEIISYYDNPDVDSINMSGASARYFTAGGVQVAPTLSGGASLSNFTLMTFSNGINANYTPVNYIAADDSVHGHLVGIDNAIGADAIPVSTTIYVDSAIGVNAVGGGTVAKPFLTLEYAHSQITDNSITKPYIILMSGSFTESSLVFKPYVFINGQQSTLTVTGGTSLGAGFTGGNGNTGISNFSLMELQSATLDFTGSIADCNFFLRDSVVEGSGTFTILGGFSGIVSNYIENITGNIANTTAPDFVITNCTSLITNLQTQNLTINLVGLKAGETDIYNSFIGNINGIMDVTAGSNLTINSYSNIFNNIVFSSASTFGGFFASYYDYAASSVTIDGANAFYYTSGLNGDSGLPTFTGGATYSGNFVLNSIADGMSANYSPTNYSASNFSVHAHLVGIDNALASGVEVPITTSLYVDSFSGTDAVTSGSVAHPFKTIAYALTQITTASSSKFYNLLCNGVFSETSISFKPYITINGQNSSSLSVSGAVNLDSSFSGGGNLSLENFTNVNFMSGASLNFSTYAASHIRFSNLFFGTLNIIDITGGSSTQTTLEVKNITCTGSNIDLTTENIFDIIFLDSIVNTFEASLSSAYTLATSTVYMGNVYSFGSVTIDEVSAAHPLNCNIYSGSLNQIHITSASSNVNVNLKNTSIRSGYFINGVTAFLASDTLSALPTFTAGATFAVNVSLTTRYFGSEILKSPYRLQIGDNSADLSSLLQLDSTSQGFLPPQMTTTQKNAISSPAEGLMVYDKTLHSPSYYNATAWQNIYSGRGAGSATVTTGTGTISSVTDQWSQVGDLVTCSSRIIVTSAATDVSLNFAITLTLPNSFTCPNGATGIFGSTNIYVASTTSSMANVAAQGGSSTTIVVGGNTPPALGFSAVTLTIGVVYSFNV